jgi:hypothetical protein
VCDNSLKQAGRQWYQKVHEQFTSIGFVRLEADHSIFQRGEGDNLLFVAVYVNDMLLFCKLINIIMFFKKQITTVFPTMDLGEVRWILNMEIVHDQNACTITLSKEQYIETILDRHGMSTCNIVATPTVVSQKLVKLEEAEVDVWEYQSSLGALMYAMLGTHPELAHCVTILSQHSMTPGHEHLTALKCVFQYLRETSAAKLMYKGTPTALTLVGYTYAD